MPRIVVENFDAATNTIQNSATFVPAGSLVSDRSAYVERVAHSNSWYFIDVPRNTFQLLEGAGPAVTVTLTPGNYARVSFATEVARALNAAGGAGNTYACAVNADTGVLSVSLTAGATNFAFQLASFPRMAAHLGFAASNFAASGVTQAGSLPVRIAPTFVYLAGLGVKYHGLTNRAIMLLPCGERFTPVEYENSAPEKMVIADGSLEFFLVDEFGARVGDLRGGILAVDIHVD